MYTNYPNLTEQELEDFKTNDFPNWFTNYVCISYFTILAYIIIDSYFTSVRLFIIGQ